MASRVINFSAGPAKLPTEVSWHFFAFLLCLPKITYHLDFFQSRRNLYVYKEWFHTKLWYCYPVFFQIKAIFFFEVETEISYPVWRAHSFQNLKLKFCNFFYKSHIFSSSTEFWHWYGLILVKNVHLFSCHLRI